MSNPSAPQRQSFPIGAAVGAVMVVFLLGIIIVVYSITQRHKRPVIPVDGAGDTTGTRRSSQKIECSEVSNSPHSGSRADGSTISISTPLPVTQGGSEAELQWPQICRNERAVIDIDIRLRCGQSEIA
ncbi:hypothetical protein GGX14DRAFT_402895 [Mycena pura]|uniref:Uncharacterized protein n=1 Tax=Mycena pura TaxID=153505 RepID=A0AAD6UZH4_9AGAR|nr:hypothetical protein GGX14DRAFT_402895 [Mycena pura]